MSNLDVEDFIQQNRAVADQVDTFRGYWESEKHWQPRREFILRNINDFQPQQLDHLLSLSMVWANNVFLGCRYNAELLEKVSEMAEGIEVEDAPVFKTRDEIMKKQQVHLQTRTHTIVFREEIIHVSVCLPQGR
uniref:XRN2-binding (XTBD) domain-containing protein n=1 Tax=Mola mola TaxID=94237 RepID=A0A3Q3WYV5_MOLML